MVTRKKDSIKERASKIEQAKKDGKSVKVTYEVDGETMQKADVVAIPKNHLKQGKMYDDFCILNQEFLKYVLSLNLTVNEYKILLFLLSYMDLENRIIIDAEMIRYNLGINKSNVNKYIKSLEKHKVIYKRNLGYTKGTEVLLNFDIISPHMVFKNKNNFDNVSAHKKMMFNDLPYVKQQNLLTGKIDFINKETGEIFHEKDIDLSQ